PAGDGPRDHGGAALQRLTTSSVSAGASAAQATEIAPLGATIKRTLGASPGTSAATTSGTGRGSPRSADSSTGAPKERNQSRPIWLRPVETKHASTNC